MLKVEGLKAGYKGTEALHGISVSVGTGKIVSVVGANGAGKSTLVNTISRLVNIHGGWITFDGKDITGLGPADVVDLGIIQVPEGRQLFGPLTVLENLKLGFHRLRRRKDSDAAYRQKLEYIYELFPRLKEREEQRVVTLSGGEQQMVAMGRALMAEPKLLLLDEPSLGLAPLIVERIFDVLSELRKEGLTMLLVEQHADEALALADYGYVLSVGNVTAEGPGETLRGDAAVTSSYLGHAGAA
jgi:branched-chain amino acid transport system ATP-binding protein